jgi:hypothetical protein
MTKRFIGHGLVALSLFGIAWIPINALWTENTPAENPTYIRRVYGNHTVGQRFHINHPLHALTIVARAQQNQSARLLLSDEQGQSLGHIDVALTDTDQRVHITLDQPLAPGEHLITFHTLTDVPIEEAILLRIQVLSERYAEGNLVMDGQDVYGDLGFRLYERVPLWRVVMIWGQVTGRTIDRGAMRLGSSLILATLLFIFSEVLLTKKHLRRGALIAGLLLLAVAAISIRLPYLSLIEGVFGGDAFNYLSKAQALLVGSDPFAADPRKGPLFPLLLVPGFFLPDPLMWSRVVGIGAAAATVVLLPLLARSFGAGWGVALGSGMLLAVNQDFIWESANGLATTLYVSLVVAAGVAYLHAHQQRWQWLLVILLGLIFLTRYEGALLVVVLLPALWIRERLPWRRAALLIVTTIAIMAIPQISFLWSGVSGIRTVDDLAHDEGLALALSVPDLRDNLNELRHFVNLAWATPERGTDVLRALPLGILVGVGLYILRRKWPAFNQHGAIWVSAAACLTLGVLLFTKSSASRELLIAMPWLLIGIGMVPWLNLRRYDAVVVSLLLIVHALAITLILPKTRYYLFLLPFLSLWLAWGLYTLVRWNESKFARAVAYTALGLAIVFLYSDGTKGLRDIELEKYNSSSAHTTVMIQAMRQLRTRSGAVGTRTGPEAPLLIYLTESRQHFFAESDKDDSVESELAWIKEKNIRFLVERPEESIWQSVPAHSDLFERLHTFTTIYGESRVNVYEVQRSKL